MKIKGILEFDPHDKTTKHSKQGSWKKVAIIKLNCDMDSYYRWFIKKRYNLELNRPVRGPHVTIINDRGSDAPNYNEVKKLYDGKEIDFEIDLDARTNGEHWWLRVKCEKSRKIRELCGLNPDPFFSLHFTIGSGNEKNIEHSKYIQGLVIKHGGSYN